MKKVIFFFLIIVSYIACSHQQNVTFDADRRYGVININGDTVIPFCYDKIEEFSSSLFIAYRDTVCVLVDTTGKVLTPLKYSKISPLGILSFLPPGAEGRKEHDSIVAANGTYYLPPDKLHACSNGKHGIIGANGKEIIPCLYDHLFFHWEEGSIVVNDGKYGMVDSVGNEIIPLIYTRLFRSYDNIIIACKHYSYGLLDTRGNTLLPCEYQSVNVSPYKSSYFILAEKFGQSQIYDSKGKVLSAFKYNPLGIEEETIVAKKESLTGIVDLEGKEIIPFKYQSIRIEEGKIIAEKEGRFGLIDMQNNVLVPFLYDNIRIAHTAHNSVQDDTFYMEVKKNGRYGVVDNCGNTIVPVKYEHVIEVWEKDGYFEVFMYEKSGLFNMKGELVIPVIYDRIDYWDNGLFIIRNNEKYGVCDDKGKVVVSPLYHYLETVNDAESRYLIAKNADKYGLIDKDGRIILPFNYDGINRFSKNAVRVKKDNKWGVLNYSDESVIIPFEYDELDFIFASRGWLSVCKEGRYGIINTDGSTVLPCIYSRIEVHDHNPRLFVIKKKKDVQVSH